MTDLLRCDGCGNASVSVQVTSNGDAMLWCGECSQAKQTFLKGRWCLNVCDPEAALDLLHPVIENGGWWYLGLVRDRHGDFIPVTACATLKGTWDALLTLWCDGDRLILAQRGCPPWTGRPGEPIPNLPPNVFTGAEQASRQDRGSRPAHKARSLRVPCEVVCYYKSVVATCSRCQHTTDSRGTGEGSVKRALALMREGCPQGEQNYYVSADDE